MLLIRYFESVASFVPGDQRIEEHKMPDNIYVLNIRDRVQKNTIPTVFTAVTIINGRYRADIASPRKLISSRP